MKKKAELKEEDVYGLENIYINPKVRPATSSALVCDQMRAITSRKCMSWRQPLTVNHTQTRRSGKGWYST
jgi:hypothetical protein